MKLNLLCGRFFLLWLAVICAWAPLGRAEDSSYGSKLYRRLTGAPLSPRQTDYAAWRTLIDKKDWPGLAAKAVEQRGFIDVTVLQWATLYLTAGKSAILPLNDALSTIVGSVRDNLDARLLLSGDYLYAPTARLGVKASISDNLGYSLIEQRGLSLAIALQRASPQWELQGYEQSAGLLTTRAFASANYAGGTNRAAVKTAFESFLCRPIATWQIPNMPTIKVRRDVDRAPGGDARVFQKECRTCHPTLDGMSLALSHLDFDKERLKITQEVRPKYLQHGDVYPEGFEPKNDAWINFQALAGDPGGLGWRGPTQGTGVKSWGASLAASKSFSQCLAKRVFESVCLSERQLSDPVIVALAEEFETADSYRLKNLFVRAALRPECITTQEGR